MSATKRKVSEEMFHLQFPARKDFLTWTELGCLARALGFPTHLVHQHVNEEVVCEEDGIHVRQLHRMIELKLLNQTLHRSFNMHTADWNLCVIRKAVKMLILSVLSFEELHNIRVAYATYEASDMKGLALDQRTLLRTLKMCHRVISPKKLMHRVKHMRSKLEEANRIQLYEFFDLVLWCDSMESGSNIDELEEADGKDKDLYNMIDFKSLLSHQDQRRSRALDQRYLEEEWDFGREQLGSKHMFKGEVVYTDQRINQTRTQKKTYRGLKKAVTQSQRRVYRAHAGSIRRRPISAPDMSMYASPRSTPRTRTASAAAMYHDVQRRLHSAPSGASKLDVSDRPAIPEYVRAHTPSVVTVHDLDDVTLKMQTLQFDIITLETRCQVRRDDEMNFYIPDYKPTNKSTRGVVLQKGEKSPQHWTPEIIDNLAYPHHRLPPHHAHTCDARFRGWKPAEHHGRHRILTVPTFDNSPNGLLLAKQRSAMLAPVAGMHKDYVIRYTSKKQATEQQRERPCTAPAASPRTKPVKRLGCRSAGKVRNSDVGSSGRKGVEESVQQDRSFPDPGRKYSSRGESETSTGKPSDPEENEREQVTESTAFNVDTRSPPAAHNGQEDFASKSPDCTPKMSEEANGQCSTRSSPSVSPMRSNRSKTMDMGLIGTVTLLESIQEHDVEDKVSDIMSSRTSSPSPSLSSCWSSQEGQHDPPRSSNAVASGDQRTCSHKERWDVGANRLQTRPADQNLIRGAVTDVVASGHPSKKLPTETDSTQRNPRETLSPYMAANTQLGVQSNRMKIELPPKAGPPVLAEDNAVKHRKDSAASSTMSEESEPREVLTPLTSVTVTIKNKDQNVRSSTRVNNEVDDLRGLMNESPQSPLGFKSIPPCVTSTPRKKMMSPSSKTICRIGNKAPNTMPISNNRPGGSGRERSNVFTSTPDLTPGTEIQPNWQQDQILAFNSSCAKKPNTEGEAQIGDTPSESRYPNEDDFTIVKGDTTERERTSTIQFSPDILDKREIAYRKMMMSRKKSEQVLKLHDLDLDTDRGRRFVYNKATTRRLLGRVEDMISTELINRIKTGDTGLSVA